MAKKKESAEQKRIRALLAEIGKDPAFKGEGVPGIAEALGYSHQAIYKWVYSSKISMEAAKKIEVRTNARFTRQMLCPWAYA